MLAPHLFHLIHPRAAPATRQHGVVTLLTSIVILLLATIFVVAVSKTSLIELRLSANEIRARQAAAAAEAGLNIGAAYLTSSGVVSNAPAGSPSNAPAGADKNRNGVADELTTPLTGSNEKYSVAFCDPTQAVNTITCPATPGAVNCTRAPELYFRSPLIVACGWSDDILGRSMMSQGMGIVGGLSNAPTNPLTSKGGVNVNGAASVVNQYNNLTIWSGNPLNVTSATGKTFVRNPALPPLPSTTPPPVSPADGLPTSCQQPGPDFVCTTNSTSKGSDVIDLDPTLSNLTTAAMFQGYFGVTSVDDFQTELASIPRISAGDSTAMNSLIGVTGEYLVIDGVGIPPVVSLPNGTIGSRNQPVTILVNGNWTGGGNTTIYGMVYVKGDVNLTGGVTVVGATAVEGQVAGTGNLTVVYDPTTIDNVKTKTGKPGAIPGSWRDWRY